MDDIVGLQQVVELGFEHLHVAFGIAAVDAQAAGGAAQGGTATGGQPLHDAHAALQAKSARTLHFTVDVVHRRTLHIDDVATGQAQVVAEIGTGKQGGNVDFAAHLLAFAHADQHHGVCASGCDAAGGGKHVGQAQVGGFQREAAGAVDLTQHGNLVAADLQGQHIDLGLQHEATIAQTGGDGFFCRQGALAADLDGADQRKRQRAAFRYPGLGSEVGVLEDGDANDVTGAKDVFALICGIGGGAVEADEGHEEHGEDQADWSRGHGRLACLADKEIQKARGGPTRPAVVLLETGCAFLDGTAHGVGIGCRHCNRCSWHGRWRCGCSRRRGDRC